MDFLKKLVEILTALFKQAPNIDTQAPNIEASGQLTSEQLAAIYGCPLERANKFIDSLNAAMDYYEIDTPLRKAHFLAQIGHESGRLKYTKELWGPTPAQIRYEGRRDLGNTQPGDGQRYMGRGLIQLTGRSNYEQMSLALGADVVTNPHLVEQPHLACMSAAWFWHSRNLNEAADDDEFLLITKRINGGTNGLQDRSDLLVRAKQVLKV